MDLTFRVDGLDDPSGAIDLARLEQFVTHFRSAILRSAQAELGLPAYRRRLEGRDAPRFRLQDLSEGSTALLLRSVEDGPLTTQAVARHLDALAEFQASGSWPSFIYPGERENWGRVYTSLLPPTGGAVGVTINGSERGRLDRDAADELQRQPVVPTYSEIDIIGELHLIEWEEHPKFRIRTPDIDLVFQLPDDRKAHVDDHRWRRVRAHALWEVGSRRASLIGDLEDSADAPGVLRTQPVDVPKWTQSQTARIAGFRSLRSGWLGPTSRPIQARHLETAQEITRRVFEIFGDKVPTDQGPYWIPTPEGTLEFEWVRGDRELICEVVPDGFAVVATENGAEVAEETVGQRRLVAWIAWLLEAGPLPTSGNG